MITPLSRSLLMLASLLMTFGGASHAAAFFSLTLAAVARSNLSPFYGNSLKLLWLADSCTMFILAVIFGFIAARPAGITRPIVMLLALIPAATAVLLYTFLGNFFAGHLQLATAALVLGAGLRFPGSQMPTKQS